MLLLCATSNNYRLEPSDQAERQIKVFSEMQFPSLPGSPANALDSLSAHTHPNQPTLQRVTLNECHLHGSAHCSLSQTKGPYWPQSCQNVQVEESVGYSRKSSRLN